MGMPRVTGHVKQTIRPDLGLVINDQWITQAQNSHFSQIFFTIVCMLAPTGLHFRTILDCSAVFIFSYISFLFFILSSALGLGLGELGPNWLNRQLSSARYYSIIIIIIIIIITMQPTVRHIEPAAETEITLWPSLRFYKKIRVSFCQSDYYEIWRIETVSEKKQLKNIIAIDIASRYGDHCHIFSHHNDRWIKYETTQS